MTMPNPSQQNMIPPLVAHHVLERFGYSEPGIGIPAGSFHAALLECIVRADDVNLDLLMAAYPEWVAAYRMAAHRADGIDRLRQIARAA